MLDGSQVIFALQLAVAAYVIAELMAVQGQILEPYLDFLIWLHGKSPTLARAAGYCAKC